MKGVADPAQTDGRARGARRRRGEQPPCGQPPGRSEPTHLSRAGVGRPKHCQLRTCDGVRHAEPGMARRRRQAALRLEGSSSHCLRPNSPSPSCRRAPLTHTASASTGACHDTQGKQEQWRKRESSHRIVWKATPSSSARLVRASIVRCSKLRRSSRRRSLVPAGRLLTPLASHRRGVKGGRSTPTQACVSKRAARGASTGLRTRTCRPTTLQQQAAPARQSPHLPPPAPWPPPAHGRRRGQP